MPVALIAAWALVGSVGPFTPPDPPGRWIGLTPDDLVPARQWSDEEPIVGTYFFYWYDSATKEHWLNPDGSDALVDHPTRPEGYSYRNPDWWEREMRDVLAAGIDFIAPVYWGVPGQYESGHFQWSFEGLRHLVTAWERMEANGEEPPAVALFYDTSTLRHNWESRHIDLTTEEGKVWFYTTIRDFFSLIPPKMWAMRNGGPIVFLYSAAFAKRQDPTIFADVKRRFREDFACEPYIVREVSWEGESDALYSWGGALGLKVYSVAALGPGYDHHAVPGRKPLVVDRRGGAFYRESWERFLSYHPERRAKIVMIETWNELHEGTDIAESVEYGRQYIDLTAEYVVPYKNGEHRRFVGPFTGKPRVAIRLDRERDGNGLSLHIVGDGQMVPTTLGGVPSWKTAPNAYGSPRYAYFSVDDSFAWDEGSLPVRIEVTFWDAGVDAIALEYDSADPDGSVREGAFKRAGEVAVGGTETWRTATFDILDARFANRCNGADFRFVAIGGDGELAISEVVVTR